MSLFKKKKGVEKGKVVKKGTSSLPALPKLPELPRLEDREEQIQKLPDFPSASPGKRFSKDMIKNAVAGGKKEELLADEFLDEDEMRMMQEPARRPLTEEIGEEALPRTKRLEFKREKSIIEPIFIRIDQFEEALRIFNETKKKISEIERILTDIKGIKEREENELKMWENEIRSMKEQIEKVDKDIFSKI